MKGNMQTKMATTVGVVAVLIGFIIYVLPALIIRPYIRFAPLPDDLKKLINETIVDMDGGVFTNNSGVHGPRLTEAASKLTKEDIKQYKKDGYIIIRNAIPANHFQALKAMYTHIQDHPNIVQKMKDGSSCSSAAFGTDRLVPELGSLLYRLNLHWVAQRLLESSSVTLFNTILHYNARSCKKEGSILSTHTDYFTAPFTVEKDETKEDGFWGDNGVIAWIAIDEISQETVTMQIGKGSHLRYTKAYPNAKKYTQLDYCPLFTEDLQKEDNKDKEFADSFFELPKLNPGDAVFFNGLTYHRPIPYCKKEGACTKNHSRRMTIRYIDGERTKYRDDVPSLADQHAARWCPAYLFQLLGEKCRVNAGDPVKGGYLPVVVDIKNGRSIPGDGASNAYFELDPWSYFIGMGRRVHHDTCDLESEYINKIIRRGLHRFAPRIQKMIWGEAPKPRPGEELVYGV